ATREASESVHCELCGCPRDLLSEQGRRSLDHYAGHDVEAAANGEREKDARLQAAGRKVRLSWVYVWSLLLDKDGADLPGHDSVEETSATHLCVDQRRDRTE